MDETPGWDVYSHRVDWVVLYVTALITERHILSYHRVHVGYLYHLLNGVFLYEHILPSVSYLSLELLKRSFPVAVFVFLLEVPH